MIKGRYCKSNLIMFSLFFISLLTIFSIGMGHASAADSSTIYVSTNGSDSWNGQSATYQNGNIGPKLTIQNATGTVSTNGTVNIADGVYSGTKDNNININKNMTIQGQSTNNTIISGSGVNYIFMISSNATVTINNLTLTNGKSGSGGAITNDGTLTVTGCTFTGNSATSDFGGAIYNIATLTVTSSAFNSNSAVNHGGAIGNTGTCE